MADKLTPEQIKDRLETTFTPHTTEAEIHDYKAKISLKIWAVKDGTHLFTLPDLSVHDLQNEGYLKDVIDGTRREIADKLKRG